MSINLGRRRFVMQSLAVAAAGEMSSSGAIKDAAASVRLPAWRRSLDVGAWITIPGTAMTGCDLSAQIEAGLCGPRGENIGFGNPRKGIMDFSGGTLKRDGSEMLVFGGGGAGAWARL